MAREKISTRQTPLVLASGSPRRRQLLTEAGVEFEIIESGIDEQMREREAGRDFALRMAR